MSKVMAKDRHETRLTWVMAAFELRTRTTKFLLGKKIPDDTKYLLNDSIFNTVDKLASTMDIISMLENPGYKLTGISLAKQISHAYIYVMQLHGQLVNLVEVTNTQVLRSVSPLVEILLQIKTHLEQKYGVKMDNAKLNINN